MKPFPFIFLWVNIQGGPGCQPRNGLPYRAHMPCHYQSKPSHSLKPTYL